MIEPQDQTGAQPGPAPAPVASGSRVTCKIDPTTYDKDMIAGLRVNDTITCLWVAEDANGARRGRFFNTDGTPHLDTDDTQLVVYWEATDATGAPLPAGNVIIKSMVDDSDNRNSPADDGGTRDDEPPVPSSVTVPVFAIQRDEAGGAAEYVSVTDANRNVLPGQKMNLKLVLPGTMTLTDWQWTLPGKTFKDYTANQTRGTLTPLYPDDLNKQTVAFYWADAGDNREVKCTFKANGVPCEAKAVFNVKAPTSSLVPNYIGSSSIIYDTRTIVDPVTGQPREIEGYFLGLYPNAGQDFGIKWAGQVQVSAGFAAGSWNFVQLVQDGAHKIYAPLPGGFRQPAEYGNYYGQWVLDSKYPYNPGPFTTHPGNAGS